MTALSDLVDDLHTYWPSLVAPDQSAFWAHEVLHLARASCVMYAYGVALRHVRICRASCVMNTYRVHRVSS